MGAIPRVLVAGLRGGSGKTLLAVGLQEAWRRKGRDVAPFKKGPDYIDSAWSTPADGRPCRNLDLFLLEPDTALRSFVDGSRGADVAVIEGNRGLFDGADARGTYSTAELAKLLRAPVLLVLDCTKATRTVAAAVLGCQHLDPEVVLGGVVLNRVAGRRHESVIRQAVEEATGVPVLGAIPRLDADPFPERHLGLVPPAEHAGHGDAVSGAADVVARYVDVDAVAGLAGSAPPLPVPVHAGEAAGLGSRAAEPGGRAATADVRIGVFRDAAFQFYYPENLEALEREGGRLVEISPLTARSLPDVDALYIGGGFPEMLADGLTRNRRFRRALRDAAWAGLPIYAECGGAVYLGDELEFRGQRYSMAGVLPVSFGFQERPSGHGYTVLETVEANPFFPVGTELRGHEFHYTFARSEPAAGSRFAFRVERGYGFDGRGDGLCVHNVLASYSHVHALSVPAWAPAVIRAAREQRARAGGRPAAGRGAPGAPAPAVSGGTRS